MCHLRYLPANGDCLRQVLQRLCELSFNEQMMLSFQVKNLNPHCLYGIFVINYRRTKILLRERQDGDGNISWFCLHHNFLLPGKALPLLPMVKILFNHVSDVLSNVPSFQMEYGIILRHLLAVVDYRFHLRNRIYCSEFFALFRPYTYLFLIATRC